MSAHIWKTVDFKDFRVSWSISFIAITENAKQILYNILEKYGRLCVERTWLNSNFIWRNFFSGFVFIQNTPRNCAISYTDLILLS